jgi:DMSO/TMAO reductase YedYZ molybdopterin-dependent catalytic subunit
MARRSFSVTIHRDLPKHEIPKFNRHIWKLEVGGTVAKTLGLSLKDLLAFPRVKLSEDFRCLEGWAVKDVLWEGIPVSAILEVARVRKEARFVLFGAGRYTYEMSLRKALKVTTMLAIRQSGRRLTISRGGPLRLVFEGHDCYESVKWVDRIEVLMKPPEDTARNIALSRIGLLKSKGSNR